MKLQEVLKIFSHQVRTPLSVIANDLQYINSNHPDLEAERGLKNIQAISNHLTLLDEFLSLLNLPDLINQIASKLHNRDSWKIEDKRSDLLIVKRNIKDGALEKEEIFIESLISFLAESNNYSFKAEKSLIISSIILKKN